LASHTNFFLAAHILTEKTYEIAGYKQPTALLWGNTSYL